MRKMPDNAFDLACCDPPYGDCGSTGPRFGGMFAKSITGETTRPNGVPKHECEGQLSLTGNEREREANKNLRFGNVGSRFEKYKRDPTCWTDRRNVGGEVRKKIIAWDVAPDEEYFKELFRVSRNQIIWGGNYFDLPPTRCFVVWRKTNIPLKGFSMSPVEYAWTSFNRNAVCIEANAQGTKKNPRWHPTAKPVSLYEELLMRFANKGDKILDTHVGSGSSLIACYNLGFEYTGFEIDEIYYAKAKQRIEENMAQIRMVF